MKKSNDNNTECDVCGMIKDDVRFEGSFDGFICDSCLEEQKEVRAIANAFYDEDFDELYKLTGIKASNPKEFEEKYNNGKQKNN